MPVTEYTAESYEEFMQLMSTLEEPPLRNTFVLFTLKTAEGEEVSDENCSKAEVVIKDYLTLIPKRKDINFVTVKVENEGLMTGPFASNRYIRLLTLPTLIRWKGPEKLMNQECSRYLFLGEIFKIDALPAELAQTELEKKIPETFSTDESDVQVSRIEIITDCKISDIIGLQEVRKL